MDAALFSMSWSRAEAYAWTDCVPCPRNEEVGIHLHAFERLKSPPPFGPEKQRAIVALGDGAYVEDPFEERGLFRIFADTEESEDGFVLFASRYGRLGLDVDADFRPPGADAWEHGTAELFSAWCDERAKLREAVALWDGIRTGEGLTELIEWTESEPGRMTAYHLGTRARGAFAILMLGPDHRPRTPIYSTLAPVEPGPKGLVGPARQMLRELLASRLRNRLTAEPHLEGNGVMSLSLSPSTLLDAMWLQLALAISGDKDFRACKHCGKWFELSPETARTNRIFCSNSCRTMATRARQNEALKLHAQGMAVVAIAEHVGSDVKKVEEWIAKARGKPAK